MSTSRRRTTRTRASIRPLRSRPRLKTPTRTSIRPLSTSRRRTARTRASIRLLRSSHRHITPTRVSIHLPRSSPRRIARTRLLRIPIIRVSMVSRPAANTCPAKDFKETAADMCSTRPRLRHALPATTRAVTTAGTPDVPWIPAEPSPAGPDPSPRQPPVPAPTTRCLRAGRAASRRRPLPHAPAMGPALVRARPAVVLRRDEWEEFLGGPGRSAASGCYAWVLWTGR